MRAIGCTPTLHGVEWSVFALAEDTIRFNIGQATIGSVPMTALKCLAAAAAALTLSVAAAVACDDYEEEMAVADAVKASKLAQSADAQAAPNAQTAAPATNLAEPTNLAAADPKPASEPAGPTARQ